MPHKMMTLPASAAAAALLPPRALRRARSSATATASARSLLLRSHGGGGVASSSRARCFSTQHDDGEARRPTDDAGSTRRRRDGVGGGGLDIMRAFASDWNAAIERHPQAALASFLSAQGTTWLGLYGLLSAAGVAHSLPPSLAAGWAVAKATKKFRQPANAALAAAAVSAFPALGSVKVAPLVTGFVVGREDAERMRERLEGTAHPMALSAMRKVRDGVAWLEGPVDRYGLSYYLSSRINGVAVTCAASYLVHVGVDVGAILSDWGVVGEGLGRAAGTAAAASILNVAFVPIHFYASVYGVGVLEKASLSVAKEVVDGKLEAEGEFRRRRCVDNNTEGDIDEETRSGRQGGDGKQYESESEYRKSEYERISDGVMKTAMMLLLAYSLTVSLYSFRLLGQTAASPGKTNENDEGEECQE